MSSREEMVRGLGEYLSDLCRGDLVWASFVRSVYPHALIKSVHSNSEGFYSGRAIADLVKPLRVPGRGLLEYDVYPVAIDRVLYMGEPLAVVLSGDQYSAEDASEDVEVDYEALPPVASVHESLEEKTLLHPDLGTNILYTGEMLFDEALEAVRSAPVNVSHTFYYPRQTAAPLHGRGVLAQYTDGELVVYTSTQAPFAVRSAIAESLGLAEDQVRVMRPDVGGGFGSKSHVYGEEIVVAALAYHLKRTVGWIEDRRESLIASTHAHETQMTLHLGATSDGHLLAFAGDVLADVGAHSTRYAGATLEPFTTSLAFLAPYRVDVAGVRSKGLATNKAPAGAYRGVGFVPGTFASELIMNRLANELNMDPAELRLRNLLTPEDFPYRTALNMVYDAGDYRGAFQEALEASGYAQRKTQIVNEPGCRIGVGVAAAHMPAALGSAAFRRQGSPMLVGYDGARVRVDADGSVQAFLSSSSTGQGHDIAYSELVGRLLGVHARDVKIVEGDTSLCPTGTATLADRSAVVIGASLHLACEDISRKMKQIAGSILGAAEADIAMSGGEVYVKDAPETTLPFSALAQVAYLRSREFALPTGMEPGLESTRYYDPENSTYGFSAQVATVSVDTETGEVRVLKYTLVKDTGEIINETIVHEQAIGSVACGVGNALLEQVVYSDDGQILTASFMDYLVPMVADIPTEIIVRNLRTPGFAPGGYRGAGNLGTVGAPAAIAAAVADALGDHEGTLDRIPIGPDRVLRLLGKI